MGEMLYSDAPGALGAFIFFTLILGSLFGAATGRAIAGTWGSVWVLPLALLALAAAVRFLHYALAGEDLSSLQYYVVSLVVVTAGAAYGYRAKRTEQMCRQYPWLFTKTSPVGWSNQD